MSKIQHVARILLFISTALSLAACNSSHFSDPESQYIGNYKSPFAEKKVTLTTPVSKVINKKTNAKVDFDTEQDSIPASVLINMNCARDACEQGKRNGVGRITCAGYKKSVAQKWPPAINRFSFSYTFEPGETPDIIATALAADSVDNDCVVGISNYAEMKLSRTNDPDVDQNNPTYAQSPYLDQIDYFSAQSFIGGLTVGPQIGIIDADFYLSNNDIPQTAYLTDISGNGQLYDVEGSKVINIGGAPLTTSTAGHGNLVSELIAGTGNNAIAGVGVASQIGYSFKPKLVAANVRSVDPDSGVNYISVDNINNALALMAYMKVDVINMSLGVRSLATSPPDTMLAAILSAIGKGSVVVVAAGNDSFNMTLRKKPDGTDSLYQAYPAAWGGDYYGLITVAALNSEGTDLASFSNFGADKVDIAAPGHNMTIAGNSYKSGTSFSAPLVTGAVAIMASYYKTKGINVVPAQIEIALLAGSKNIPALNPRVRNGLSLNIPNITTQLMTKSISQIPNSALDNDGFWYTREGTSMNYSIRTVTANVDEADTSLHIGIWEKLDPKLPPLAEAPAHNGVDNFELPFYNFVVGDEGIWVVLYRSITENNKEKRIFISSKLYKFTDLIKTPTVDESNILGAINQVNTGVDGWACLSGRPDHVMIDVHVGSPTGPVAHSIPTSVQPKGREYFDQCTPFVVTMGFNIPLDLLAPNADYYFVARHPTNSSKSKLLNSQAFRIEVHEQAQPVLYNLKKNISVDKISIKGSVCWENQSEPGFLSYYTVSHLYETSKTYRDWFYQTILPSQPEINAIHVDGKLTKYSTVRPLDYRMIDRLAPFAGTSQFTTYDVTGNGILPGLPVFTSQGNIVTGGDTLMYLKRNSFTVPPPDYAFSCCGGLGIMKVAGAYQKVEGYKTWFIDQTQVLPSNYQIAASNPLVTDDSTITVSNSTTICSANKKAGVGQDFIITLSKASLANHFNIGDTLGVAFGEAAYTVEQKSTFTNQLNATYTANLNTGLKGIMNTILSKGDFNFVLLGYTQSSSTLFQKIKVSDLVNY